MLEQDEKLIDILCEKHDEACRKKQWKKVAQIVNEINKILDNFPSNEIELKTEKVFH
jgi:hypothetical protein